MLDDLIADGRAVTLIHRVLNDQDLVLREELMTCEREGKLVVVNVLGDRSGHRGKHLLTSRHLVELIPDVAEREIVLCGPPAMMRRVRASLAALGIPASQIHTERFALAA